MLIRMFSALILVSGIALSSAAFLTQGVSADLTDTSLIRDTRSTNKLDVCKFSKGSWSTCNLLTKLETREDTLRTGASGPDCPRSRVITRNCNKDKSLKPNSFKKGLCVYAKARDQEWSDCQNGVRQKLLKLLSEKPNAGCPKTKVISKKCKNKKNKNQDGKNRNGGNTNKKNKNKSDKKKDRKEKKEAKLRKKMEKKENKISEKCDFGAWSNFSTCENHQKTRKRQILRGGDVKLCRKQSQDIQSC